MFERERLTFAFKDQTSKSNLMQFRQNLDEEEIKVLQLGLVKYWGRMDFIVGWGLY